MDTDALDDLYLLVGEADGLTTTLWLRWWAEKVVETPHARRLCALFNRAERRTMRRQLALDAAHTAREAA